MGSAANVSHLAYEIIVGSPSYSPRLMRQIYAWKPISYPFGFYMAQARNAAMDAIYTGILHTEMVPRPVCSVLVGTAIDLLLERELGGYTIAQFNRTEAGLSNIVSLSGLSQELLLC